MIVNKSENERDSVCRLGENELELGISFSLHAVTSIPCIKLGTATLFHTSLSTYLQTLIRATLPSRPTHWFNWQIF